MLQPRPFTFPTTSSEGIGGPRVPRVWEPKKNILDPKSHQPFGKLGGNPLRNPEENQVESFKKK